MSWAINVRSFKFLCIVVLCSVNASVLADREAFDYKKRKHNWPKEVVKIESRPGDSFTYCLQYDDDRDNKISLNKIGSLSDITYWVSPKIRKFITGTSPKCPNSKNNSLNSMLLSISIPSDSQPNTYAGVIRAKIKSHAITKAIKIHIKIDSGYLPETDLRIGTTFRKHVPGPNTPGAWPTWVEGPKNSIIMAFDYFGKIYIANSRNQGKSWTVVSVVHLNGRNIYGWASTFLSRISENSLLLRLSDEINSYWVRSYDNGHNWIQEPVLIASSLYASPAPIRIMTDNRWAATFYEQTTEGFYPYLFWSYDQGMSWLEQIRFPMPIDGNTGLTESDVIEIRPGSYVAAIRADEGIEGADDGFYLTWSEDAINWSSPVSMGDKGRMPHFYKLDNLLALSYRIYDPALGMQHGAIRFSRDGIKWSTPIVIEHAVNNSPFIVQTNGKIIALSTLYPDRNRIVRTDITKMLEKLR